MQAPFNPGNRRPLLQLTDEDFERGYTGAQAPDVLLAPPVQSRRRVGIALLYGCVITLAAIAIHGSQRTERFVLAWEVSAPRVTQAPLPAPAPVVSATPLVTAEPIVRAAPPRAARATVALAPMPAPAPAPSPAPSPAPASAPAQTTEPEPEQAPPAEEPPPTPKVEAPPTPPTTADGKVKLPGIDD